VGFFLVLWVGNLQRRSKSRRKNLCKMKQDGKVEMPYAAKKTLPGVQTKLKVAIGFC